MDVSRSAVNEPGAQRKRGARGAWCDARSGLTGVLIATITIIAFYPTLKGTIRYDDEDRLAVAPLSVFAPDEYYRPLTRATLLLDKVLWGPDARGYHAVNLGLHVLNSLLLYALGLLLIAPINRRGSEMPFTTGDHVGAAIAALLFALHPLRVEAVAWVSQRAVLLSALFLLLSVLLYVRGRERTRWLAGSLVCYAVSLAAGPTGLALPIVLVLLDWYPLRRLAPGADRSRVWLEKVPFCLLAIVAVTLGLLRTQHAAGPGMLGRLALAAYGSVFYVWQTMWPEALLPLYELPTPLNLVTLEYLGAIGLTLAALAVVLWYRRRVPGLTVATVSYVLLLLPAVFLMQTDYEAAADRFSYLPSIAWTLLAGAAFARLWSFSAFDVRVAASGVTAVGLASAGVLAVLTWQQGQLWQTPVSVWNYTVERGHSSGIALYRLGQLYLQAGERERAAQVWQAALYFRPPLLRAYLEVGDLRMELGQVDEALAAYRGAAAVAPQDAEAQFQLGNALAASGEFAEAEQHFRRAIALDATYVPPRSGLGHLLMMQHRWEEATEVFRAALALAPQSADLHFNLGRAALRGGHPVEAAEEFRRALAIDPEHRLAQRALEGLATQPSD